MLNRNKLLTQLERVEYKLFTQFTQEIDKARALFEQIKDDEQLCERISAKKHSVLTPKWSGKLSEVKSVTIMPDDYSVLAVDGSQIYYDKHQGPACYLINVGMVQLEYGKQTSQVKLDSVPYVLVGDDDQGSVDHVNLQREKYELEAAWHASQKMVKQLQTNHFVCLFDGTIIFFQVNGKDQDTKEKFLKSYLDCLQKFYEHQILCAGYISFPKAQELVNILRLVDAGFCDKKLKEHKLFDRLTDQDVAAFLLKPGQRTMMFASRAPISYLYPAELKPYFCYLHVGKEIVRIEMPAWIAQQESLLDRVCQIAFDQALKGQGYPVCLFESHEQAVVKVSDREFFYLMVHKMSQQHGAVYARSVKSVRKQIVPV